MDTTPTTAPATAQADGATHRVHLVVEALDPDKAHHLANSLRLFEQRHTIAEAIGRSIGCDVRVGLVYDSTEDPAAVAAVTAATPNQIARAARLLSAEDTFDPTDCAVCAVIDDECPFHKGVNHGVSSLSALLRSVLAHPERVEAALHA